MLGIKPFVQESVQALPPVQLRLLAETLRIDLRGCDDRNDIERVLTGLVCLDQDTTLGVFLAWLRSADLQHKNGILASKKPKFNNTFLPAISKPEVRSNNQATTNVKDHHLDDEIRQQLKELEVLETSLKEAERLVHTGTPSFEKLKKFLLELTILRAKEQTTRAFLVRQINILKDQHGEMRAEMLHSRAQLDFFVEGFTNLRKRHDALLTDASQMKAENETAQEMFFSMSAHDCYFEQLMRNTLWQHMRDSDELKRKLKQAHDDLEAAAQKRKELDRQILQLKEERGDARKDAYCYKRQLRVCKTQMEKAGGVDCSFFRDHAVELRQTVATLLGLLRDAIVRDTKSPKQTLSKEALRILRQVLSPSVNPPENDALLLRSFRSNQEPEREKNGLTQPRVIHRQNSLDIDEVIKGVLLVEGAIPADAAECAQIMCEKLKYVPIDLKQTLAQFQQLEENQAEEKERQRQLLLEQQQQTQQSEGQGTDGQSDPTSSISLSPNIQTTPSGTCPGTRPPPTLEIYADALKNHISDLKTAQSKRGFIMYNWPFSTRDVILLTAMGLPVDSVINLEIAQAAAPLSITAPTPIVTAPAASIPKSSVRPKTPVTTVTTSTSSSSSSSRTKPPASGTTARGKVLPTKSPPASKSPPKSTSRAAPSAEMKSRAASPTRPAAKATPTTASKPKPPTALATSFNQGSSASLLQSKPSVIAKVVKKTPTAASALQGLGDLVHPVGLAVFPVERVNCILQVLEQQKRRKLAPIIQWDEPTRRTNEMLAMWAEEVHMLVHLEQDSRKPKKAPIPVAPVVSPVKVTTTSPRKTTSPGNKTAMVSKTKQTTTTRSSPTKEKATSTQVRPRT